MRITLLRYLVNNIVVIVFVARFCSCTLCDDDAATESSDSHDIIKRRVTSLVEKWAPKLWLDPQEKFFPSNVSTFLKEVTPTMKNGLKGVNGDLSKIPTGEDSKNFYFVTKEDKDVLLKDPASFLHGVNPTKQIVSVYANVKACDPAYNSFIVTYWFFYPFNEGKKVCTIPLPFKPIPVLKVFNKCLGKTKVYGSHIGDWEHVSLEIKDGEPTILFLSVHNVGVSYLYDRKANIFLLSRARSRGLAQAQDPPETVQIGPLGHPILFSAKGSHAFWSGVGTHKYTKLNLNELSDATDFGTPWETWRSVEMIFSDETAPDWYNYEGRWGNPGSHCLTKTICEYVDGPPGLCVRKPDFDCRP